MSDELSVSIKLLRGMDLPEYATSGSAAVDLRAALEGGSVTLAPGEWVRIPTGVAISTHRNDIVAVLAGRSGLGAKHGVTLLNGIGVIDSDYRGEISATLINRSAVPYTVNDGDRIAQLMFMPMMHAVFDVCDELDSTERGEGGFGSTGKS